MEKILEEVVEGLRKIFGEELVSVVLYGSAALGNYVPGQSNLNLLVAVENMDLRRLGGAVKSLDRWRSKHGVNLIFFTTKELQSATDTFPIEFSDMKKDARVLFGRNPLEGLEWSRKHLRLQTEFELRSKLLVFRQNFPTLLLSSSGDFKSHLIRLATSIIHVSKYLLDFDETSSKGSWAATILEPLSKKFGIDTDNFARILALKTEQRPLRPGELEELALGLHKTLSRLVEKVDSLPETVIGGFHP